MILFTNQQVDSIRRDLKLSADGNEDDAFSEIERVCEYYLYIKAQRDRIGDIGAARANVSSISNHSKALIEALDAAPCKFYYTRFAGHTELVDLHRAQGGHSSHLLYTNLRESLLGIVRRAHNMEKDDNLLRKNYTLPNGRPPRGGPSAKLVQGRSFLHG